MATYVFCRRASDSALELVKGLGAVRLRNFDGMSFWRKNKRITLQKGDILVCWGDPYPETDGVRILNGADPGNKYDAAQKLVDAGVKTISAMQKNPSNYIRSANEDWIPRRNDHVGGNDLLTKTKNPDFWVKKENVVEEYRIHIFNKKSIRAGVKKLREGYSADGAAGTQLASPWVRSYDGGWRVVYDNFQSKKDMRALAHKAVETLGLDFGAVDLAKLADGSYMVLEVNRAPGLEGGTIEAYVSAISGWINDAGRTEVGSEKAGEVREVVAERVDNGDVIEAAFDPAAIRMPRAAGGDGARRWGVIDEQPRQPNGYRVRIPEPPIHAAAPAPAAQRPQAVRPAAVPNAAPVGGQAGGAAQGIGQPAPAAQNPDPRQPGNLNFGEIDRLVEQQWRAAIGRVQWPLDGNNPVRQGGVDRPAAPAVQPRPAAQPVVRGPAPAVQRNVEGREIRAGNLPPIEVPLRYQPLGNPDNNPFFVANPRPAPVRINREQQRNFREFLARQGRPAGIGNRPPNNNPGNGRPR